MRIRTIKPEFWRNQDLAKLPEFTRLLAIALLNYADDDGYFLATPELLRGELFPFSEDSRRITVGLTELSNIDYLRLYNGTNGRIYGIVTNFTRHQKISNATESKIKGLIDFSEDSRRTTVGLREDSHLEQGTGNREQGTSLATPPVVACEAQKTLKLESPKAAKEPRQRNELFDALATATGKSPNALAKSEGGQIAKALKGIMQASPDVSAQEIRRRAEGYRRKYRDAALTPTALEAHWSEFAPAAPKPADVPIPEPHGWRDILEDSKYGPGGIFEAATWAQVPRDVKQVVVERVTKQSKQ
jgi:hypothetical protein